MDRLTGIGTLTRKQWFFAAANWKMNQDLKAIAEFFSTFRIQSGANTIACICPPFVYLHIVREYINKAVSSSGVSHARIELGAQDVYPEDKGAYTGAISPAMLKDIGCKYVIIGHSERRRIFKEDVSLINRKVHKVLEYGLSPILCIGETAQERKEKATFRVLANQLRLGLHRVAIGEVPTVIIAYEPVWAIGTGINATKEQAQEAHEFIRTVLREMYSYSVAENMFILYGGSVSPENSKELASCRDVDGFLVGSASLNGNSFSKIITEAENAFAVSHRF
ncbi:MAG: triose-phosphate isomerase [Thermoplasmata archaeon]